MVWKEVKTDAWAYEKEGDSIEGVFLRFEEGDKEKEISNKYYLETKKGFKMIWGSAVLDQIMVGVNVGERIKLTYKGLGEQKDKKKNPPKIFKLEKWEEEPDVTTEDIEGAESL